MNGKFKDKIRVLGFGDISKLSSIMSSHFFVQLSAVSDQMTQEPRTIDELNAYVREGGFTHVVVPDEHFHRLQGSLERCVVPVVELLGDHWVPWAVDKKKKYIEENGIKNAFVFSERFHEPYENQIQLHPVSFGFDSSVFSDQESERDIDVLIHGSLGQDTYAWAYPVRNWLARVLPEIGIREGINVVTQNHPGYGTGFRNSKGTKAYSHIINRSKIATGGSGHWRLPFKKFYEVPACGTILLSDIPLEDTGFFKGRILEVDPVRINSPDYEDVVRGKIMSALADYDNSKERLQPFGSEKERFYRSFDGRALEMRAILKTIR